MRWRDDARKLMQGFVAPERRAISIRLDTGERIDTERDRLASERYVALIKKFDDLRRGVKLQIDLALATRRVQELKRRQQRLALNRKTFRPRGCEGKYEYTASSSTTR
jgi:hypothetical protein